MSDLIILTTVGDPDEAVRIMDAFEAETGLSGDVRGDERDYEIDGEDHRAKVVQTLTDVDPDWTDHVGLRDPD